MFVEQFANSPLIQNISRAESSKLFSTLQEVYQLGSVQGLFKPVDSSIINIFTFSLAIEWIKQVIGDHTIYSKATVGEIVQ